MMGERLNYLLWMEHFQLWSEVRIATGLYIHIQGCQNVWATRDIAGYFEASAS